MPLLSKLSENRAAILRLGEQLGLEHPQWAAIQNVRVFSDDLEQRDAATTDDSDGYFGYGPGSAVGAGSPTAAYGHDRDRDPVAPARAAIGSLQSRWPALLAFGALTAVLAVAWLALARPFGGVTESADSSNLEVLAGDDGDPAGPEADDRVAEISAVLRGLGLNDVLVERQGAVIQLSGSVLTEAELGAALGVAQALSGGEEIDVSGLTVMAGDGAGFADPGARAAALQVEIDRVTAATPVIFGQGARELTELHMRILNNLATIMVAYPGTPITIVGYTDDVGSDDANRELSLSRADAVRGYLMSQGVAESQLTTEARGEDTSTGSEALANLERRVEFEVVVPAGSLALPSSEAALKVAIVSPSARNDMAFSQSMVDAVNLIAAERGNVEIAVTDNTFVPDEAAAAISDYASQGYDLVIAHGSQFGSSLVEIAPQFPDVAFAWGTASDTFDLPNVYAYDAASEQGGYVMGAMSSLLSSSGTIGVVGPIEVGDAERYVNGFKAGAEDTSTSTEVVVTYTGSFSDLTLAAETAQSHIAAGADVMTGSAQMVVGAVSIANENGVLWFGTQANQENLAPGLVVASQVYHWEVILRQIVRDLDAGVHAGTVHTADLANGGLVIEYSPSYDLDPGVRQRADQIVADIAGGAIEVPS